MVIIPWIGIIVLIIYLITRVEEDNIKEIIENAREDPR